MAERKSQQDVAKLRLVSSGTKIWNQFMMFVVVGLLPVLFPRLIYIENRMIVFAIVTIALVTSYLYEIWRIHLEKRRQKTDLVLNLQLLTSVFLLTLFLHFFGRINGPFFVLYLLTIMESFLNLNIRLSNIVVGVMIGATIIEFLWLVILRQIILGFIPIVELTVRLLSIVFIRTYGLALAQKTLAEEKTRNQAQDYAKRLEKVTESLKNANERLKELDKLKDEFVYVASHELRTPMTAIKSYLWLALNKTKGLQPKLKRNLARAYDSTERLISLVQNMLTVSRIEGKRLVLSGEEFDLCHLAKQVHDELKIKAEEKKIEFTYKPYKATLRVRADKARITEVIQNLVGNALKFTPEGGQITMSLEKKNNQVQFAVADSGPGIPKEQMPQLFKKFSRMEHAYRKRAEASGTGLGLYISKQVIDMHQGKIWAESEVGKGSRFVFTLPLKKPKIKNKKHF